MTRRQLVVVLAVWAGFAAFAAWRAPVPGVNEPHYLCKAKHFSDPWWCARDLFLASADVHWVFYATFGPLTRVFSFDQTAWIGRILVWGLLAFGWVRLVGRIVPGSFAPIWSACIFLAIQATGNLSGEWLIGGVESKGFAYAALLFAIAAAGHESWLEAGLAAGVAISFHPVVGVWGVVALAAARFVGWASQPVRDLPDPGDTTIIGWRRWRQRLLPVAACLLCSLPGLIPAIAMLVNCPTADEARLADEIQVFYRLKHHLDPAQFSTTGSLSYAGLIVAWLAMRWRAQPNAAARFFARFILATMAIAAGGFAVGFCWRSPALMKFYPFRLFDVCLPIAVAIAAAGVFERFAAARSAQSAAGRQMFARIAGSAMTVAALAWGFRAPGRVENASRWPPQDWTDFMAVCHWIEGHTSPDAVFLTPMYNVGFKWYARRAEYATWKDCPQDAVHLLEWKERIDRMKHWHRERQRVADSTLAELANEFGIDYVLTIDSDRYRIPPVHRQGTFAVYLTRPARE